MFLDNWIPVESSSISRVRYRNGNLDVEFKETGKIYRYYQVPDPVYNELMSSSSIGKFFIKNIKNKYEDSKIELNELESKIIELRAGKVSPIEFSKHVDELVKSGLSIYELEALVNNEGVDIKVALAFSDGIPDHLVTILSRDSNLEVKKKIATRSNLREEDYLNLLDAEDSEINSIISNKENLPPTVKSRLEKR